MEDTTLETQKGSLKAQAYELLETLQAKHTQDSKTLYLRRREYPDERFFELDLKKARFLEKEGILSMSGYLRQGSVDPNVTVLNLLPKGLEFLKGKITIETHQKILIEPQPAEEPQWKANKKYRQFARTERGCGILTSCPEALISDVQGNITMMKSGTLKEPEWKARQFWLKYELLHRYEEIPEPLRHEAEDYRDLQYTPRKKMASKEKGT